MHNFRKILRIGSRKSWEGGRWISIFIEIEFKDGRLSITGVEGPIRSGNALGSSGQIDMNYAHRNPQDNDERNQVVQTSEIKFAPDWTPDMWLELLDVWKKWHLNDMQAGCVHQQELGWDKEPIDPTKPTHSYGKFYPGQESASWNLKGWVYPPYGHLTEPCPVCGYKYGTAWLRKEVPYDVLKWLMDLPDTDRQPAWV